MYQPPAGDNTNLRFTEAYTPPADGGAVVLQFSGKMSFVSGGGAIAGGSAIVEAVNIQVATFVASGGAIAGGAGDITRDREISGSGGAVGGGTSEALRERSIAGAGGAVVGGVALHSRESSTVGSGGAVAGGDSDLLAERRNIPVFGDGGAVSGGVATIEAINLLVMDLMGSGGAVVSGEAGTNRESSAVGSGGAVAAPFPQSGWPVFDGAFDIAMSQLRIEPRVECSVSASLDQHQFSISLDSGVDSEVDLDLMEA